jgi:hypothetical protein
VLSVCNWRTPKKVCEHSHVEDRVEDGKETASGILGKQIVGTRTGLSWRRFTLVL